MGEGDFRDIEPVEVSTLEAADSWVVGSWVVDSLAAAAADSHFVDSSAEPAGQSPDFGRNN